MARGTRPITRRHLREQASKGRRSLNKGLGTFGPASEVRHIDPSEYGKTAQTNRRRVDQRKHGT